MITEAEIVEVIHRVVAVPTSEDDHRMLNHNCAMAEPI
jgi:hypothetical protein